MIELSVAGDSNELSHNKRLHWRSVAKLRKEWKDRARAVAFHALSQGSIDRPVGRVEVSFIVRRGRRLDSDNACSSLALKAILDGLVEAGLLGGDTLLHCERGDVLQETEKAYKLHPEVVVRLVRIEGEE